MRSRKFTFKLGAAALACAAMSLASSQALAVEYSLRAGTTTVYMPNPAGGDPVPVQMWGYADCSGALSADCGTVTVPGPALVVPPDDSTLTVHLLNSLGVPTSMVINGLIKPMTPVWDDNNIGARRSLTARVRSFDTEAGPNGTADYSWGPTLSNPGAPAVKPGTYLYQSGTQPQVQVQMGLYGAMTKEALDAVVGPNPAAAQAYSGVDYAFDSQATLVYSEIDPVLHAAIANGSYGTAPAPTSTLNYTPKYFLINGQPFPNGTPVIPAAGTTLLRLLNAGLTTHVPMIQGTHWTVVAEDGKPYPYRRTQYTALLPAAKTMDVLVTPDVGGAVYPVLDRRLSLSNNGLSDGGMLAFLQYNGPQVVSGGSGTGGNNAAPSAVAHSYDSIFGVTLNVGVAEGVLADTNNTGGPLPVRAVAANGATACTGTYTLNTSGSFIYMPPATLPLSLPTGCTASSDSFSFQVTNGKASAASTVTINLAAPELPKLAVLDNFARGTDPVPQGELGSNWMQQKATGTSGKDVGVTGAGVAVANSTTLGGLAIWHSAVNPGELGPIQAAGATLSANAYLVLKAGPSAAEVPVNYIRVGCEGSQIVVSTSMGGSNVSVHAKQAAFGSCGPTGNVLSANVDAKGLVTVFDSSGYVGGVQLPDVAAWKGGGRIGIQLTAVGATANGFAGPLPPPPPQQ